MTRDHCSDCGAVSHRLMLPAFASSGATVTAAFVAGVYGVTASLCLPSLFVPFLVIAVAAAVAAAAVVAETCSCFPLLGPCGRCGVYVPAPRALLPSTKPGRFHRASTASPSALCSATARFSAVGGCTPTATNAQVVAAATAAAAAAAVAATAVAAAECGSTGGPVGRRHHGGGRLCVAGTHTPIGTVLRLFGGQRPG